METQKFYWIKLRTDFYTQDNIDFLMGQKDGANYVVLYQMLCLKTANNNGELGTAIGEMIVPYDIDKIVRDCKYFTKDTVVVALELYKKLGLIYRNDNGVLTISNISNLIGSETAWAEKKRIYRENKEQRQIGQKKDNVLDNVPDNVREEIDIDKDIDIKEKSEEKKRTFVPPTLEEVQEYAREKQCLLMADKFYEYFTAGNWVDSHGNKVRNWKQKFLTWKNRNTLDKLNSNFSTGRQYTKDECNSLFQRPEEIRL